jgi:hypothetical protein
MRAGILPTHLCVEKLLRETYKRQRHISRAVKHLRGGLYFEGQVRRKLPGRPYPGHSNTDGERLSAFNRYKGACVQFVRKCL